MLQRSSALIVTLVALGGCGHPAVGIYRGVTAAHAVNNAAFDAIREIEPEIEASTRRQVVAEYEAALETFAACRDLEPRPEDCTDPGSPEEWMDRWRSEMDGIRTAEDAIYTADGALVSMSRVLDEWQESGETSTPEALGVACGALGEAMQNVLAALRRFEVEYPDALDTVSAVLSPVCRWAVDVFSGADVADEAEESEASDAQ